MVKLPPDQTRVSWVNQWWGNVFLDSNDLKPTGPYHQRPAFHEFGHMLGLIDEYGSAWMNHQDVENLSDNQSVMHSGEKIRPSHYQPFVDWINKNIPEGHEAGCRYGIVQRQ